MGSTFIPSRCAQIDTVGSNVLIRGNMPLTGPDLHYALKEIQAASKVSDLLNRHIIEVPIIDNVGERPEFVSLMTAFGVNPDQYPTSFWPWWTQQGYDPNALHGSKLSTEGLSLPGSVVWRPFEGMPANTDPKEFLDAPWWDFSGFIENIINVLKTEMNAAVYVHCQLGADRTGAFHIGYLMKTQGLSLAEASAKANASTSAGAPNADYQRLVAAYAQALG